jgi:hypothetical protein
MLRDGGLPLERNPREPAISDHYGKTFAMTSVQLVQGDERRPENGYFCEWMPYQVGQAAKHAKPE